MSDVLYSKKNQFKSADTVEESDTLDEEADDNVPSTRQTRSKGKQNAISEPGPG